MKGPVQEPQNGNIASLPAGCLVTQDQLCEEVHSGSSGPESGQLILSFCLGSLVFCLAEPFLQLGSSFLINPRDGINFILSVVKMSS